EEVHCELQPEGDEEDTVVFWLQSVINHLGVSWVHAELRLVQLPDEDPGFMEKEL
ncbi:unnamed protein product, partial [Effrenium voratum]